MDIQTQKLQLIDKILHMSDSHRLAIIDEAINAEIHTTNSPSSNIAIQKIYLEKISKALEHIKSGDVKSHNDLKNETNGW
jgi:hypothetical protein